MYEPPNRIPLNKWVAKAEGAGANGGAAHSDDTAHDVPFGDVVQNAKRALNEATNSGLDVIEADFNNVFKHVPGSLF